LKYSVKSGTICFFLDNLFFKSARLFSAFELNTSSITFVSNQSSTIEVFFSPIISTMDNNIKSKLSCALIFSKPINISSFLPSA